MADYDAFAADYDLWAAQMPDDVSWYVELAVGTGRVAVEIARRTGKRVLGIDASPAMLEVARRRAGDLPLELRVSDMRELALDDPVELVICPGRSLLHLPTERDRATVFERVAAALAPGGRFAWNAFAYKDEIGRALDGTRTEQPDGLWQELHYDFAERRVDITRGRDADTHGTLHLWWLAQAEWEALVAGAGLEVEALYGGFAREPFGPDAGEFVYVARKPR